MSPGQGKPRKNGAILGAIICLLIGLSLLFSSFAALMIYGPLFLAAFVLSIIGMAQGRIVAGLLLLLATLIIPTLSWFGVFATKVATVCEGSRGAREEALSQVVIEEQRALTERNYITCLGRVRNNGASKVKFIKIGVEWLDERGTVIDTDWTYAVGSEGLRAGAAKSFRIMTRRDPRIRKWRCFIIMD